MNQKNQELLAVQAIRSLNIATATELLNQGKYRIKNFFYATPTSSGIGGLELIEGEDKILVGKFISTNSYNNERVFQYIIISKDVTYNSRYPMIICEEVFDAYLEPIENSVVEDPEKIYKHQLFLASIFGIY